MRRLNNWVQATPGYALLFVMALLPGAPDSKRSAVPRRCRFGWTAGVPLA
jgi:hypothetical protein